ncbi:MAG: hypothetical protein DWQ10_13435 [Calditrichaeota bacterium]|nr:MAG: hypothetical protein DWQ10_13435 [Calditrichota bacterium]
MESNVIQYLLKQIYNNKTLKIHSLIIISGLLLFAACDKNAEETSSYNAANDSLRFEKEVHLRNIKQLTFGGNNAEAYWSFDNKQLVFQSEWDKINEQGCDQIFIMNADGSPMSNGENYRLVSTGKGRTTCSYFLPDGRIVYASTHAASEACPPMPESESRRYVWPLFSSYSVYIANNDGSNPELLIGGKGYNAEATVSPDGKYIIYTSTKSGDLELWLYEIATGEELQLTSELGYDGGAFFSHDSKKIVWRASRPEGEKAKIYKELLANELVEPSALNIFIADIDGSNVVQVTDLEGANWAPFFHPDGKRVLFCSNHHSPKGGMPLFDIFMINIDGTGLKQITHSGTFDSFPMFSFDGKKLVFCSNRTADRKPTRDTNVFVADWIENPEEDDLNFKSAAQQ